MTSFPSLFQSKDSPIFPPKSDIIITWLVVEIQSLMTEWMCGERADLAEMRENSDVMVELVHSYAYFHEL